MVPQGLAYFDGIEQIVSAEFTLSHGITPGVCYVKIAPQVGLTASKGTLQFAFDNVLMVFPDCRVDMFSVRMNLDGQVVSFNVYDRRWRWVYPVISGFYNQVLDEAHPLETSVPGTRFHARALASMLLNALGETQYDVSQLPTDVFPAVDWDYTSAAKALDELVTSCGCRVVLTLSNIIQIAQSGIGDNIPTDLAMELSVSESVPEVPDYIAIVCAKNKYQVDIPLTPVGLDLDGSIRPIDELSYAPKGGWSKENPQNFLNIPNVAPKVTIHPPPGLLIPAPPAKENANIPNSPRDLALRTVWRWYCIGWEEDDPLTIPFYGKLVDPVQMLPLDSVQCQVRIVGQDTAPMPAQVFGTYAEVNGTYTNSAPWKEYKRPFRINGRQGIVIFQEPVYTYVKVAGVFTLDQADLVLRTSFHLRDNSTFNWVRYQAIVALSGATPGPGVPYKTRTIVHDDIQVSFWREYELTQTSVTSFTGNFLADKNDLTSEKLREITYYSQMALQDYQIKFPAEACYAGLLPISPDGAIQQVTWSVGLAGATTRVSRNSEHSTTTPPYAQRKQSEQIRFLDFRASGKSVSANDRQIIPPANIG